MSVAIGMSRCVAGCRASATAPGSSIEAIAHGLEGWVHNRRDGSVEGGVCRS